MFEYRQRRPSGAEVISIADVRHARASMPETSVGDRAASVVNFSAVTPAALPLSEDRIALHHSEGMERRCHHLETCQAEAPTSAAIASRDGQSSMTARNELGSLMPPSLGPLVLNVKDQPSRDAEGRNVLSLRMGTGNRSSDFKKAFTARVKAARMATGRTQQEMADELGLAQDRYKQYEGRTLMPHELLLRFSVICDLDPGYFFTGRRAVPSQEKRKSA